MNIKRTVATSVLVLVPLFGLTSCKLDKTTATAAGGGASAGAASSGTSGGAASSSATNFVPVGQALTVGDDTNSGTYTLVTLTPGAVATGDAAQYAKPQGGNQYVLADVQVESKTGTVSVNPFYFSLQTSDNRKYTPTATIGFDPSLNASDIPAGQTTRGNVLFEIPAASAITQLTVSSPLFTSVGGWTVS